MSFKSLTISAVVLGLAASAAQAASTMVNTFDNGWYRSNGYHSTTNTNTYTRKGGYNSFYAFDLSALTNRSVTSATITFVGGNGTYQSSQSSLQLGLFDVSTAFSSLLGGTGGTSTFTDLASGTSYGSTSVSGYRGAKMPTFSVVLNGAALADINAAITGQTYDFAIGAALLSGGSSDVLWSSSYRVPAASLSLVSDEIVADPIATPVPVPAALPLLLGALGGLGLLRRRRRA